MLYSLIVAGTPQYIQNGKLQRPEICNPWKILEIVSFVTMEVVISALLSNSHHHSLGSSSISFKHAILRLLSYTNHQGPINVHLDATVNSRIRVMPYVQG